MNVSYYNMERRIVTLSRSVTIDGCDGVPGEVLEVSVEQANRLLRDKAARSVSTFASIPAGAVIKAVDA